MQGHRYYATQRPFMPGTVPGNARILGMENFPCRRHCAEIGREAWGYIVTEEPLPFADVAGYELVLEDADQYASR